MSRRSQMKQVARPKNNELRAGGISSLLWALVLMVAGVAFGGYLYLLEQRRQFDVEVHNSLGAVADARALQVGAWRRERLADVRVLAASLQRMPEAKRVLDGSASAEDRRSLEELLDAVRSGYHYSNVSLTKPAGEVVVSSGGAVGDAAHFRTVAGEAAASNQPRFREVDSRHLCLASPLQGAGGGVTGAIILEVSPDQYLNPTLRSFPGAGASGELVLIQRTGNKVRFLSERRFGNHLIFEEQEITPGSLRPSVQAAQGGTHKVDGVDYRGVRVVAAARPVEESNWFVVAKLDEAEAYGEERRLTNQLLTLLGVLVAVSACLVWLLMKRQQQNSEVRRKVLEDRYNFLRQTASDAMLVFDGAGRILEINDRAVEMFGYTREELLTLTVPDLKPTELRQGFFRVMDRVEERHGAFFETLNRRKDGSVFPTEVSSGRVAMEGEPVYQSLIRDISERREAEIQIRRLNHLYLVLSRCTAAMVRTYSEAELMQEVCRIAVEAGGFLVSWVGKVDPQTQQVVAIAKAGPEALYLDEISIVLDDEKLSRGPSGLCIQEGRAVASVDIATDPHMEPWREAAAKHGLRSSICLPLSRRGQTVYVMGLYSDEAGFFAGEEFRLAEEVGESLSLALDRLDLERERAEAERQRAQSQERLELALEAASEAYWDWQIDSDEWFMSPRFYTMLGLVPGEHTPGMQFMESLIHPDDLGGALAVRDRVIAGKVASDLAEFRVRHRDGHFLWVLATIKVVSRDEAGNPRRVVGTRIDITAQKVLEQEFLQAQKMETVGRLAGGVAHDFNNHLTVINGYSDLMRRKLPPESEWADKLDAILDAGQRAAALTRQLLVFSRKNVEKKEKLFPNQIIEGMQKMLLRLLGENVKLSLELAKDAGWVEGDPTHLEQVVLNLAINARDAIGNSGTVTILTACTELDGADAKGHKPGRYARITVTDTGCGMTPEVREHIFEPFFTTKDKDRGTGLGLATVYGIVQRSGGFLEVESEPEKGSAFHVYLPAVDCGEQAAGVEEDAPATVRGRETVLVVEDDDAVRKMGVAMLDYFGYKTVEARDAKEAIAILSDNGAACDAVMSDIMMPGMSGPEMVEQLRRKNAALKVLFVSGYANDALAPGVLSNRDTRFLQKPYAPKVLARAIEELLSGGA